MKKIIFSIALVAGINFVTSAQEKTSVGILPFTYIEGSATLQDVNSIQETIINAFVKTKRFNIVDRSKMDALKKEKELQKSEDFIDGSVIKQGISLGADYLISGHVISANAERMETSPSKRTGNVTVTYKAKLSIQLKVIDVATGQVINSESIEPKSGSTLGGMMGLAPSSPQAAVLKAIKGIEDKVDDFVYENFPATFPIVEIQQKDSEGYATQILIAGGSAYDLQKGDRLKVVEVSIVEVGEKKIERKKQIGEIIITTVEDENFSTCSVDSGGIEINSKFEAKAKLLVITND
jgi:hypothetical protein